MHKQLLLVSAFLAVGATAQAQWATQPIGFANPTAAPALIEAVSPTVVWTIGYDYVGGDDSNQVGLSTNGGLSWTTSTVTGVNTASEFVSSLSAISNTTAWVAVVGSRADGRIMKTTDGGLTWVRQTTAAQFGATNSYPTVVHFFNANDGVAIGDPPVDGGPFEVYVTSNGGTTWTAATTPPVSNAREDAADDAYAVAGNTIWCGTLQGRVLRSTDKGLTWTAASTSMAAIRNLAFRDAQNGLATYLDEDTGVRQLERTTDGGATWARVSYTGIIPGFGLDNVPGSNQYISTGLDLGDGIRGTAYSRDNGQTWVTLESTSNNLFVDFISPTAGWTGAINPTTGAGLGMRRFTSSVLGSKQATAAQLGYSVFPNPSADGHFEVRAQEARTGTMLRVSDALGREVVRRPWTGNGTAPVTLDLSQYRAGVYTLEISSAAGTAHQKLVVK
ncbi:T9SS type A sorting domain-containing protein [Hymenobacter sp. BT190]|uniref:T9SS type A sorting domain-containing protein n=1 Tax=Hymenobacter sp. BT190 TaxID=2763505 RepID=UPI001650E033|nr:T9SS type A sorting domain-containing protein [Hymenobacter sp. BT190]MBC6698922.1 T9SS type A sorting domain-containing protein [Hymenobacter sp. BT190]